MPNISSTLNLPLIMIALLLSLTACGTTKSTKNSGNDNSLSQNNFTSGSQQEFTVNVGNRIFFATDSSILSDSARITLDKQSLWLSRYAYHSITLEGHADERGTREYNLALGARRAAITRDYLVAKGIARNRIHTISYGKERPMAACNNVSCWSKNRRVMTLLSAPSS